MKQNNHSIIKSLSKHILLSLYLKTHYFNHIVTTTFSDFVNNRNKWQIIGAEQLEKKTRIVQQRRGQWLRVEVQGLVLQSVI